MILKTIAVRLLAKPVIKLKKYRYHRFIKWVYLRERLRYYEHATTLRPIKQPALVSVVIPCFNTPAKYLEPLLSSVFAQGYENWELILVDASTDEVISAYIKKRAGADKRIVYIRTENKGIATNTNVGINSATGKYIAFADHDDTLDYDALAESVRVLESNPQYGLVYSDEDKISDSGDSYFNPHFKPGFSLDMLRNVNYITHFVVVRKSIIDQIGGIREGFDGAQDYDFLLRVVDTGVKFAHIPKILYHWRVADGSTAANFSNKQNILDAGCRALDDHYKRNNIKNVKNKAIEGRPGFYRPEYKPSQKVSRVIRFNLESYCLGSLEKQYIIQTFRDNHDVIKYKIAIEDASEKSGKKYDTVFTVAAPVSPLSKETDIISMFALAEEEGVCAVAPKITRHGKMNDMGIVNIDEAQKRLFENVIADKNDFFGSLEWVRNVDCLTEKVFIQSQKHTNHKGRNVIWSHGEFTRYELPRGDSSWTHDELEGFYNQNITENSSTTIRSIDYVSDVFEEVR